jgi:hypothetical protein
VADFTAWFIVIHDSRYYIVYGTHCFPFSVTCTWNVLCTLRFHHERLSHQCKYSVDVQWYRFFRTDLALIFCCSSSLNASSNRTGYVPTDASCLPLVFLQRCEFGGLSMSEGGVGAQGYPCTATIFWSIVRIACSLQLLIYKTILLDTVHRQVIKI